jgi:hypothetical protein
MHYRIIVSFHEEVICDTLNMSEQEVYEFWPTFETHVEDWLNSHIEQLLLNYHKEKHLATIVFSVPNPQVTEEMDAEVDLANEQGLWEVE